MNTIGFRSVSLLSIAVVLGACSSQRGASDLDTSAVGVTPRDTARGGTSSGGDSMNVGGAHPMPPMRTSAEQYEVRKTAIGYEAVIPYTFTNSSGDSIFLVNCNNAVPPAIERMIGERWEPAWYPTVNQCLSPPVIIPPGATYSDSLYMVVQPFDSAFYKELETNAPNRRYRLIWTQALGSFDANARGFGKELPPEVRSSNAFILTAR